MVDVTAGQFPGPFPYGEGRRRDFLTAAPSRRARELMAMAEALPAGFGELAARVLDMEGVRLEVETSSRAGRATCEAVDADIPLRWAGDVRAHRVWARGVGADAEGAERMMLQDLEERVLEMEAELAASVLGS